MPIVLISTVIRRAPLDKPSGYLYVYDTQKGLVTQKSVIMEPAYREYNSNPRGGMRGSKGMNYNGEIFAVANGTSVFYYDRNWKPLDIRYHPSASHIHEIFLENDNVWVTSTENDLLCLLGPDRTLLKYFDARVILRGLGLADYPKPFLDSVSIFLGKTNFRDTRTHNWIFSNCTHINSIEKMKDGSILISLGLLRSNRYQRMKSTKEEMIKLGVWKYVEKINEFIRMLIKPGYGTNLSLVIQPGKGKSVLVRIKPDGTYQKILTIRGVTNPSHTVRILSNGEGIYLNTTTGEIIFFNPDTGQINKIQQIGKRFLRGALELDEDILLVGDHCDILHFNKMNSTVTKRSAITENQQEAILCITALPPGFDLPPLSFLELHKAYPQFTQEKRNDPGD